MKPEHATLTESAVRSAKDLYWALYRASCAVPYGIRRLLWAVERARFGIADCDSWDLDGYVSSILVRGLRSLADGRYAQPADMTAEEWRAKLLEWAQALDEERMMDDGEGRFADLMESGDKEAISAACREVDERKDKALHEIADNFPLLWS